MNLLAVVGSARKGKATDTLVDKAAEGALSANPRCVVNKVHLIDRDIRYCNGSSGKAALQNRHNTLQSLIIFHERPFFA